MSWTLHQNVICLLELTGDHSASQVAVKALADCGVRDVILYPGAKCIELLKVVDNNHYGIRGWLCRNEHAGAFVGKQACPS